MAGRGRGCRFRNRSFVAAIVAAALQDSNMNAIHRNWTALDEAIQQGPDCSIATPGRLNDFVQKKQVCGAHSERPEE